MSVVLTILKVILWIILILLGLVLLLLLLILLCPIHYKADVKYAGKAKVGAKIRYMIFSVKILFNQETKQLDTVVRVFGIRFKGGGKHKNHTQDITEEEVQKQVEEHGTSYDEFADAGMDVEDAMSETVAEDTPEETPAETPQTAEIAEIPTIALPEETDITYGEPEEQEISIDSSELLDTLPEIDEEREAKVNFVAGIIAKISDLIEKIAGKLTAFSGWLWDKADEASDKLDEGLTKADQKLVKTERRIDRFIKFWELECTEKTKVYLIKYIKGAIRHIAPRKAKGYAHYGFDEPYKTGTVTGYLSVLPCMYQKKLILAPDFYEKVMDVDVSVKGHIVLGYLVRIIFNINLWKTYKAFKRMNAANNAANKA